MATFIPVPELVEKALIDRVHEYYKENIKNLPKINGLSNPSISATRAKDGYSGNAKFYDDKGGHVTSLWEYKDDKKVWYMIHDWND